ncbi:MAG: sensor histidine kinase [Bacteroidota bacterium]
MKGKKLWLIVTGCLLLATPAVYLFSQQIDSGFAFDSIYKKGLGQVNANIDLARQCLKQMERAGSPLKPVEQAKICYLRMQIFYSDADLVKDFENKMFAAPDSLGHKEALVWTATRYLEKSMPDKAIPLLMEAIEVDRGSDWTTWCTIHLCEAYREKQEYVKGSEMLNEILYKKPGISDANRAFAYNRLAAIYNESGKPPISYPDSVIKYSKLCLDLSEKINSKSNLALAQNELSYQYYRNNQLDKALEFSREAFKNFKVEGMRFSAMNTLINQSNIHIRLLEYTTALQAVIEATGLCPIEENRNLYMRLYLQFATIYSMMGNYRDAYDFLSISRILQADFFQDRMDLQINDQSARYNLLIKEQRIKEQEQQNEFHKKQIAFLIVTVIVLCVAFMVSIFYLRLRRKAFLKQRLIEAVVETEASERKRIARDLHDGLGPVLSAINLYFQAYVDAKAADKHTIETKIREVISDAIDDVSRISHNISPHVLEIHGLNTALNNFISALVNNSKIKVEFSSELTERFELNKELTIYRCITELLNNTMKHADANRITISIYNRDKGLQIIYTDNGKGFDTGTDKSQGMGLYNIKNRVETFGGQLNIENIPKMGIKFMIDIPL